MKLGCEHNRTTNIHPTDKKTCRRLFLKESRIPLKFIICQQIPFSQQAGSWRTSKQCVKNCWRKYTQPCRLKVRTGSFNAAKRQERKAEFHQNLLFANKPFLTTSRFVTNKQALFNPLNPELNPIYVLALLGAHHFLHVSRMRVKLLTFRRLMS